MLANEMGARVIALDISSERLAIADGFGANAVVNSADEDPIEAIQAFTRGRGVDMAIDCSGSPDARIQAVRATRTWGTVCFVGEGDTVTLDVSIDIIRKQLTIIGSWTFSSLGQADCARFIAERDIKLERIFTHRFSLEQAEEAIDCSTSRTTGKGVFVF